MIRGYCGNEKANREAYDDEGYFKTGDVLFCEGKSKKWYTVERKNVRSSLRA